MKIKQISQRCAYWQRILRLQDWLVTVQYCRYQEMSMGQSMGSCQYNLQLKKAAIRLLDPIDGNTEGIDVYDVEETLIHELLHLHMAAITDFEGENRDICVEQVIDCIATGMMKMVREAGEE